MNKLYVFLITLFSIPMFAIEVALIDRMLSLEPGVFSSFNHCQNLQELNKHASYFSKDVEFIMILAA